METDATQGQQPARTFWPTDYDRLAKAIRHVRQDEPLTADVLAGTVAATLAADSPDFDSARWTAATYQRPAWVGEIARTLRQSRHLRCQPLTAKPGEHQGKVDALAAEVNHVLTSAGIEGYDPDRFAEATRLPASDYGASGEYSGEDEDQDQEDEDA
jgi:hypothetical protein